MRNRLHDPRIRAVVAGIRDITAQRQAAGVGKGRAAPDGRVELAEIMERWPRPAVIHSDGLLRWANRAAAEFFEMEPDTVAGRPLSDFIPADSAQRVAQRVKSVLDHGEAQACEIVLRTATGRPIVVETCAMRTTWDGSPAVHLEIWDVTERHARAKRLAWAATHDPLTGLANRVMLADRLPQALAGLRGEPGCVHVLFIDLDGYKHVNDTLGHLAGDEVLIVVARRIVGAVRSGDTVARYGGDEFVVVIERSSGDCGEAIEATADRFRSSIAEPIIVAAGEARVTASVGWVTTTDPETDATELVGAADLAAYEAKRAKR